MNLYTIVTNDEYELPVLCDVRVKEAAKYMNTTTDEIRRMVCRPPKKSAYRPVVAGKVVVDRKMYEKRYRMEHDRSEYFREYHRRKMRLNERKRRDKGNGSI